MQAGAVSRVRIGLIGRLLWELRVRWWALTGKAHRLELRFEDKIFDERSD